MVSNGFLELIPCSISWIACVTMMFEAFGFMQELYPALQKHISATFGRDCFGNTRPAISESFQHYAVSVLTELLKLFLQVVAHVVNLSTGCSTKSQ